MPLLVLWDIDHTLIENAGVSKEIYGTAFETLTGRPATSPARTEGRTDPDIMADLLLSNGAASAPWPQVQSALQSAGAAHRQTLGQRGRVLPGVVALITALARVPRVVQTVVTGNIRANASVKLSAFGLLDWMDLEVGGYGSDDADRAHLVALARTRTVAKYGTDFSSEASTVVIGDTPRDVDAARKGGARVLAVASGIHTADDLRQAGAAHVLPSLLDTSAVVEILLTA